MMNVSCRYQERARSCHLIVAGWDRSPPCVHGWGGSHAVRRFARYHRTRENFATEELGYRPTAGSATRTSCAPRRSRRRSGGLSTTPRTELPDAAETLGKALIEKLRCCARGHAALWHYSSAPDALIDEMARRWMSPSRPLGGWESYTLYSVHDTIEFEKRGIPAAVIITRRFTMPRCFSSRQRNGRPCVLDTAPVNANLRR